MAAAKRERVHAAAGSDYSSHTCNTVLSSVLFSSAAELPELKNVFPIGVKIRKPNETIPQRSESVFLAVWPWGDESAALHHLQVFASIGMGAGTLGNNLS